MRIDQSSLEKLGLSSVHEVAAPEFKQPCCAGCQDGKVEVYAAGADLSRPSLVEALPSICMARYGPSQMPLAPWRYLGGGWQKAVYVESERQSCRVTREAHSTCDSALDVIRPFFPGSVKLRTSDHIES